jgi:hypothetical protein
MNPPFAPNPRPSIQLTVWFENPEMAEQVDMESGVVETFSAGQSYLTVAWESGETLVIPRERIVKVQIAPVGN